MAQAQSNNSLMNTLTNTLFNTKKNNQGTLYVDSGQGKELAHLNDQAFNPPPSMAGILPKAEIMQGTNPLDGQPSDDFDQYGLPLTEDGYAMMSIYNDIAKANGIPTQDLRQQNNEIPVNNIQGQQTSQQAVAPVQMLTGGVQQQSIQQAQPQSQFQEPTGLKSGIHDFLAGFNNNYNNSITEGNFYGDTQDEYGRTIGSNKMGRAGEVVGSMGRAMQNPLVQGLVATLIAKKVNPMNDIGKAAEFGFNVANQAGQSQVNKDILAQMGYPVDTTGIFNKVYDKAVKALYQDQYNRGRVTNGAERNFIDRLYKAGLLDIKNGELVIKRDSLNEKIKHNRNTEAIGWQNANSNSIKANSYASHNKTMEGIAQQNADTSSKRAEIYGQAVKQTGDYQKEKIRQGDIKNGTRVSVTTPAGRTLNIPSGMLKEAIERGAVLNE